PEEAILREIGKWLSTNGEAIYGTRPWRVYGEGPTEVVAGSFSDTKRAPFTGQDLRFTAKGDVLYATALAWPEREVTIRSLGTASPHHAGGIGEVTLLGHDGPLRWTRSESGLTVEMPDRKTGDHAFSLKIAPKRG